MPSPTRLLLASLLSLGLLASARAAVETYTIDPVHSSVQFSLRHIISKFTGGFTKPAGTITVDRDHLENSSVHATIDVASLNTASPKREEHLWTDQFFNLAQYATMTFQSKAWKQTGPDTFDVTGLLTIKGVTKEVVLKTTLLGFGPGMRGMQLSAWEASTVIKKSEFDLAGPAMLGKALGDEVTVSIAIESFFKPAAPIAPAAAKP
ncbi:MAG: YceI family protein [Verrucomicrobiota bacterium]